MRKYSKQALMLVRGIVIVSMLLFGALNVGTASAQDVEDVEIDAELAKGEQLAGIVEAVGPDSITVGGVTIQINSATQLDDLYKVGDFVEIDYYLTVDGVMMANEVEVEEPDDDDDVDEDDDVDDEDEEVLEVGEDFELVGTIESINGDTVVIAGKTIRIDSLTQFDGVLVPGAHIEIEVVIAPDGSLVAEEIEISDDQPSIGGGTTSNGSQSGQGLSGADNGSDSLDTDDCDDDDEGGSEGGDSAEESDD